MSDSNNDSSLSKAVDIVLFALLLHFSWQIADYLTPADHRGRKSGTVTGIIWCGMVGICIAIGMSIISPRYHPSVDYTPQQYRTLMAKKCFVLETNSHPPTDEILHNVYAHCVSLDDDTASIPEHMQGVILPQFPSGERLCDTYKLDCNNVTMLSLSRLRSNDPDKFPRPFMRLTDRTTPVGGPFSKLKALLH